MVMPPSADLLIKEAKLLQEIEQSGERLARDPKLLSELSQSRVKDIATIPT
jgi:hypothetical protein